MASTLFSSPETTFWSLGGRRGAVSVFLVLVSIFLIPWLIIPPYSVLQHVRHDGQYNKLPVVFTRCPRSGGNCQCLQGPQKGSLPHSGWSYHPLSHCRAGFPLSTSLTIFLPDVSFFCSSFEGANRMWDEKKCMVTVLVWTVIDFPLKLWCVCVYVRAEVGWAGSCQGF